jgi:CheY-like chemotaxis protein
MMTKRRDTKVLIVDDNRDAADSLAILVDMWGFSARVAYDGCQALKALAEEPCDCLFLDLAMPLLDGYSVAQRVRQLPRVSSVKLVALTAYSDARHLEKLWESGFDNYLTKPADPSEIKRILDMLEEVKQMTARNSLVLHEVREQVSSMRGEVTEQIKEMKQEIQEVKDEVKELRGDLKELKEGEGI